VQSIFLTAKESNFKLCCKTAKNRFLLADIIRFDGFPQGFNEVCRALGPGGQLDVADGGATMADAKVDVTRIHQKVALSSKNKKQPLID
jgi:hypothetical protein